MTAYRTKLEDIYLHESGWVDLPSGVRISRRPLLDRKGWDGRGMARGSRVAAEWARKRALRLPTLQEYLELHQHPLTVWIPPVTIYVDASNAHQMGSREWCEKHDSKAWEHCDRAGVTNQPVANFGKHITVDWLIFGWDKDPATGVVKPIQQPSAAHVTHEPLDYATGQHVVDEAGRMPPVPSPNPTLKRGSKGEAVRALQEGLGVTVDGDFGPATQRALVAFQREHGLDPDGVVGPATWRKLRSEGPPVEPDIMVTGVDVSGWQPPGMLDDVALARDHQFLIARATYGTRPDKKFPQHIAEARAAGLKVGSYHFMRQTQTAEAQLHAFGLALSMGARSGDIVPAIDLETNEPNGDGPPNLELFNHLGSEMAGALQKLYGGCLVYVAPYLWDQLRRAPGGAWLEQHHMWIADWRQGASAPRGPANWCIWQVSATHRHKAFPAGPLDLNRSRRLPLIG